MVDLVRLEERERDYAHRLLRIVGAVRVRKEGRSCDLQAAKGTVDRRRPPVGPMHDHDQSNREGRGGHEPKRWRDDKACDLFQQRRPLDSTNSAGGSDPSTA